MSTSNKYVLNDQTLITDSGKSLLSKIVTNTDDSVYCFLPNIPSVIPAAAMARLSRRAGDLRLCLLDEFLPEIEAIASSSPESDNENIKSGELISRILTEYGDDSVAQLINIPFVVENCSNLMTKKLEWGRIGAYLEQSTRYIYFDKVNQTGNYNFYIPKELNEDQSKEYIKIMNQIFSNYSVIVKNITEYLRNKIKEPEQKSERLAWLASTRAQACDAVRTLLPVATQSTVGLVLSAQAIDNLIVRLQSEDLIESKEIATKILREVRKVAPNFFERTDRPDRGLATSAYLKENGRNIKKLTDDTFIGYEDSKEVKLINLFPNDLDSLLSLIAFQSTSLDLESLKRKFSNLSDDLKLEFIDKYVGTRLNRRHRPGRAYELIHLQWQITTDYGIFRDLQRHRIVDAMLWQDLSPRLGYVVPELITETNNQELFDETFDLSFKLYNYLKDNGHTDICQYATLLGHRMRFTFTENLREAFHMHELRTTPQGHPGYRKVVNEMQQELEKILPTIAKQMKFINKDEDPELTRMAAELAKQLKLDKMEDK